MLLFPLAGLGVLGIAMIRSSIQYRENGWISGFILGLFFAITGFGGMIGILFS